MQLTLQLSFTNPPPAVMRNLATLLEVADGHTADGNTAGIYHADGRASDKVNRTVKDEDKTLRARIRQLAGCAAIALKKDWHDVWVLAYHEFWKKTNRHPVVESGRAGLPSHLDYVFTDPSWPGILHGILENMLTSSEAHAA